MADPFPNDPEGATVALVLAGGRGSRLDPLTAARSKPAIPLAARSAHTSASAAARSRRASDVKHSRVFPPRSM